MGTDDKLENATDKAKGKAKETVGDATDNDWETLQEGRFIVEEGVS